MQILEPTVLMPGNEIDIGLTATLNRNGFVAVNLGMGADPETFTPELVASEEAGMPGWRFRKEYLRDWDAQSGQPVFEHEWIERQRARACEPVCLMDVETVLNESTGEIERDKLGNPRLRLVEAEHGRIRIFLKPDAKPPNAPPMFDVRRACAIGMDVGEGVGASDSTIQVFFSDTREQAAAFNCNQVHPGELGRIAVLLARFYNNALICCVRKMHGITTLRAMMDEGYPRIWRWKDPRHVSLTNSKNAGWARGESSDELLFGKWGDALEHDTCILHDLETIEQHAQYIYDDLGRVCFQKLKSLPVEARGRHGDLVVGAALAYRACLDMPQYVKITAPDIEPYSFADRRKMFDEQNKRRTNGPKF